MRPLQPGEFEAFLQRFDSFKNGELRCINVVSPKQIVISLAAQDAARDYDWVNVDLEFNDIHDAKLFENDKLHLADMSEGVSLFSEENKIAFGINKCYNSSSLKNATCYVISSDLKYKEGVF
ncbi:MAG: hypothetical protein AB7U24_03760 [Sulfurimonadaceae bacterium]